MYLEKVPSLFRISQQILDKAHEMWVGDFLFCIISLQEKGGLKMADRELQCQNMWPGICCFK